MKLLGGLLDEFGLLKDCTLFNDPGARFGPIVGDLLFGVMFQLSSMVSGIDNGLFSNC